MSFSAFRFAGLDMMVDAWSCRGWIKLASSGDNRGEYRLLEDRLDNCAN